MSDSSVQQGTWDETVPAGAHWSGVLRRGTTLRLTDLEGGANVSVLLFNYEDRTERYNMADTLKGQHTAYLTKGHVCYSDMGRVLCSITADTVGWHDTVCGISNAAMVREKYGEASYQQFRNDYHRNGYDSLVNELGKYGLGKRDVVANINFFSKVTVDEAGTMVFHPGHSSAGAFVELRFEMDTLLALSTCQHSMDPQPDYRPRPVRLTARRTGTASLEDECRNACPENQRAFINTERLFI
ncbi:MAG: urea carboxylase-associated family protein [Gammaproteobacteria bacterium]